jgi:hypothetical protein
MRKFQNKYTSWMDTEIHFIHLSFIYRLDKAIKSTMISYQGSHYYFMTIGII